MFSISFTVFHNLWSSKDDITQCIIIFQPWYRWKDTRDQILLYRKILYTCWNVQFQKISNTPWYSHLGRSLEIPKRLRVSKAKNKWIKESTTLKINFQRVMVREFKTKCLPSTSKSMDIFWNNNQTDQTREWLVHRKGLTGSEVDFQSFPFFFHKKKLRTL